MPAAELSAIVCFLYLTFTLGYCAYKDIKTYTIPFEFITRFGYPVLLIHVILFLSTDSCIARVITAGGVFLVFFLNAKFLGGGGGDAILFPLIPLFCGPVPGLIIIAGGCFLNVPIHLFRKLHNHTLSFHEIPVVPGVFIMYLLTYVLYWRLFA